jgi:hypothetical protein
MAKVPNVQQKLSFVEIVMRADAATIKAAYEARLKIDELLAAREEAYRRIFEIESQVEQIVGEPGVFVFPPPPCPVAGIPSPGPAVRRPARPESAGGQPAGERSPAAAAALEAGGTVLPETEEERGHGSPSTGSHPPRGLGAKGKRHKGQEDERGTDASDAGADGAEPRV